jgi:hypothetical protein
MGRIFDYIYLENHNRHQRSVEGTGGAILYEYQGNIYVRFNNGTPKLLAGVVIQGSMSNTGSDMRSGRESINTGTTDIVFKINGVPTPMGVGGNDYEISVYARDIDGAQPAYDISHRTSAGFAVTVYSDNIIFGYTAVKHT